MFDNLHPEGIPKVDWMKEFYCPVQNFGGNAIASFLDEEAFSFEDCLLAKRLTDARS